MENVYGDWMMLYDNKKWWTIFTKQIDANELLLVSPVEPKKNYISFVLNYDRP